MTKAVRGIYAAAVSPFSADGSLNARKLLSYCQYLISPEGGCDGVAPAGTTGEGTSIAIADRLALPGIFADAGVERNRVIFGTGAPASSDCVSLTRAAMEAGFNNVLVLPPYYYKNPSDEGLFSYYANLVEKIGNSDLRIFLYHFPQMSMVPLSTSLVTRLRSTFGSIIAGLKDSSGDFEQSRAFVEATGGVSEGFDVLPSSEAMLWDGLDIGTAGIISGSTNAFGAKAQAALKTTEGPERDAAMDSVRKARAMVSKYPLMSAMKTIEAWRSGDNGWLRMAPPLDSLSTDQQTHLRADLAALGDARFPAVAN
ncbi:MAG: dihydrodipicolinate synthase family protein [Rhodobacteraceae bacterium]|nr:dihydrodipicolinate synthase family protein [Paracoccaceae bacterium]